MSKFWEDLGKFWLWPSFFFCVKFLLWTPPATAKPVLLLSRNVCQQELLDFCYNFWLCSDKFLKTIFNRFSILKLQCFLSSHKLKKREKLASAD
jgi:hypothetical protein